MSSTQTATIWPMRQVPKSECLQYRCCGSLPAFGCTACRGPTWPRSCREISVIIAPPVVLIACPRLTRPPSPFNRLPASCLALISQDEDAAFTLLAEAQLLDPSHRRIPPAVISSHVVGWGPAREWIGAVVEQSAPAGPIWIWLNIAAGRPRGPNGQDEGGLQELPAGWRQQRGDQQHRHNENERRRQ